MTSWSERISQDHSDCSGSLLSVIIGARYKWKSGYSIQASDTGCVIDPVPSEIPGIPPNQFKTRCTIIVIMKIRLKFDRRISNVEAIKQRWKNGVRDYWNHKFRLARVGDGQGCDEYDVAIGVEFVNSGEDHEVEVERGQGRANAYHWYEKSTAGTAAHEFGHLLGLNDEYADEKCPRRSVPNGETPPSIMQSSQRGDVKKRHFKPFSDWITKKTGSVYRAR